MRFHDNPDMGNIRRHASNGDISSISFSRLQGRIPSSGPLPSLSDSDSWLWLYGLEPFLDISSQDGNGEGLEILVFSMKSSIIYVNDGSTLHISFNHFVETIPLISVL